MKRAWANERIATRLLPHRSELVEALLNEVNTIRAQLESDDTDKTNISYGARRTDIDRVQYILNSYLRFALSEFLLIFSYC